MLDFEVARRLIGTQEEEASAYAVSKKGENPLSSPIKKGKTRFAIALDSVPVGSAIVGLLQLSQLKETDENFLALEKFFHAPNIGRGGFKYGDLNAFEGAALDYSRELATKKIIRKLRGGDKATLSTKKAIHKEYLAYYGGVSESEGSDYDS